MANNNQLIKVDTQYLPDVKKEEIHEIYRISKKSLPQLGLAAECNGHGLYKCVFPNGVSGALAVAKDGSGNLGTIMNENGIVAQARWVEQTVNPTMLFAAAALHNIEEKLDEIISISKDIFEFEQQKEESNLVSDVAFLTQTMRDYPLNAGNHLWLSSKTNEVTACQRRALKYVDEYKKLAVSATKSAGILDDAIHVDNKAKEKIEKTIRNLENYQKGVFLFAFSNYIHVLVTESFEEQYLCNIENDINRLSSEYRDIFSEASYKLEKYAKGSLDLKAIEATGDVIKALGYLADKTPLLKKTKTGEKLKSTGDKLESHRENSIADKIKHLSKYQKAPSYQFEESLREINNVHHKQLELYTDDEYVYFAEPVSENQLTA